MVEGFFMILVGMTGFEPATPCTPYKYATGLRHIPNLISSHLQEKQFFFSFHFCGRKEGCKSKVGSYLYKKEKVFTFKPGIPGESG
jgi:hypothetical protein